jgi:hypothetical protein
VLTADDDAAGVAIGCGKRLLLRQVFVRDELSFKFKINQDRLGTNFKWKKDCEKKPRVSHYRSEMSGGVMNVTIEDCLFGKELFASGVYIKSSPTRGGKVENITARRITLGNLSTSNHRSENASFCAIYTKNDHCTKTGSGQT